MKTLAIMALSLGGQFEGRSPTIALAFPTYAECSAQINDLREVFYAILAPQGMPVIGVHCRSELAPMVSPFPKARADK